MYSFCVSMPKKNVCIYIYAWHPLSTLLHYCQSFLKICLKIIIHYCKYTANTSKSNNNTFLGGVPCIRLYIIYIYIIYTLYMTYTVWHISHISHHIYHIYHTSYIHAYHIYIYTIIYVYNTYITGSVFVDQNCFVRKRPFCAGGMLQ